MKVFRKLLALCAMLCGMGISATWAADVNLPNIGGDAAAAKAAQAKASLKRDEACTKCHDENEIEPVLSIYQTKHGVRGDSRTPNCQSCHGESEKHVQGDPKVKGRAAPDIVFKKGSYAASEDKARADQCLACHKGNKRTNWDGAQHQTAGVACNDCHKVHRPADPVLDKKTQTATCFACHKEQRADVHKISNHPIALGKVVCSDCHNPHGSTGPKLMAKNSINDTCYTCHAEKRGPFLFEHRPAVEDCTNCHTPHGSNIAPLLKTRPPMMCQQCHDGTHASATPAGPNVAGNQGGLSIAPSKNLVGRACMNCHSQIHGTNSPAGGYFQR
jgi:DmsE family decaheme c-type cytochrome